MEEKEFSPEEGIQIIQSMIARTREDFHNNAFYFLVFGWVIFAAALLQYILLHFYHSPNSWYPWPFVFLIFPIIRIRRYREGLRENVQTYIGENLKYLWAGFGITYVVIIFINTRMGWDRAYPIYIMLLALGTFVSGSMLKFKPLIWGGIFCWVLSIGSTYLSFDNQILCYALGVLGSYIIPGYLLRDSRQCHFNTKEKFK